MRKNKIFVRALVSILTVLRTGAIDNEEFPLA